MAKEMWRQIEQDGIAFNYDVSTFGNVRKRDDHYPLDGSVLKNGYRTVFLYDPKLAKNKKRYTIHRLVATAFIANPENKPYVNHKNGDKLDNHVKNLEWVTAKENTQHAIDSGLMPKQSGETNFAAKYTNEDIHNVCKLLEDRMLIKDISRITGIPAGTISMIKSGVQWREISKHYDIPRKIRDKYDEVFDDVVHELIDGIHSKSEIAAIYGVPVSYVRNIAAKRRHAKRLKDIVFHPRHAEVRKQYGFKDKED